MKGKSMKALEKLCFLENYTGILSHDHEELLRGINKARKTLINEGARHFPEEAVRTYEESYQE